MFLFASMLEAIGLVLGSLLTAGLVCWLATGVAIRLHHRSWAGLLMMLIVLAVFLSGLTHSGFVRLSAVYGLCGVLFLWISTRDENARSDTPDQGRK